MRKNKVNNFYFFILSVLVFHTNIIRADECVELTKCVEVVSKLTKKKYLFNRKEVSGELKSSSNFELEKDNADSLFTHILDLNGFARIPTAEKDTYTIVTSRDLRYQALPTINVDSANPPSIPANYDYYLMQYKFQHFQYGQMRGAANSLRPFMSRYARVIELNEAGLLVMQENATKLIQFHDLIKKFDREYTKEEIDEYQSHMKRVEEEERMERTGRSGKKKAKKAKKTN